MVKPIYTTHTQNYLLSNQISAVMWKRLHHILFNMAALTMTMLFENLLNQNESMGYSSNSTLKNKQVIVNILIGNDGCLRSLRP